MIDLVDLVAERSVLVLLAEEGRILGPERARRTLEETAFLLEDFTAAMHRDFFTRASAAVKRGQALVPSVLGDVSAFREILESTEMVSAAQLGTLAERIRELSARRKLWAAAKAIADATRDDAVSVPQLVSRFADAARNISTRSGHWRSHVDALDRAGARIRAVQEGGAGGYVRSGYALLDDITGGFPPTLCVICGQPGMAKSALVGSVLRNMAIRGDASAVFSLEDRAEWLPFRWLAHDADLTQFALRNCKLTESNWSAVGGADSLIREWAATCWIDDRPGLRPSEILLAAREAYRDHGAKMVVLDNMTAVAFQRGNRMDLEIQDFLVNARAMSDEFQAPFVVVAHAKRRDGLKPGDMPMLTDCRESSGFENCARMALGVSRDPDAVHAVLQVGVIKNTFGRFGTKVELPFRAKSALLEDSIL